MPYIKVSTLAEAKAINQRITDACINDSKWTDGITNNYCNPYYDQAIQAWIVPILDGYEQYFTESEIEQAAINE